MNKQTYPVIILIYSILFLSLFTQNGTLLVLLIPSLILLLFGFLFPAKDLDIQVERKLEADRTTSDSSMEISLQITNNGDSIEILYLEDIIPDGLKVLDGQSSTLTSLEPKETVQLDYTIYGRRGAYAFPAIKVKVSDYLGLNQKEHEIPVKSELLVLPRIEHLPEIAIQPRRTRVFPGSIPSGKAGTGVSFLGVREYQTGDPMRRINERASARRDGVLIVNEFEQERAVDIGIILDCRTETNLFLGRTDLLEHGIQAAATLADSFLRAGNRVGLLVYGGGRSWVQPGYGKVQRERILQALASVQVYDRVVDKALENLPTRFFPAKSQLVLVSSLLPEDTSTLISLRAHGYKLLVISPDPIDFEANLLEDRETTRQAVRIARIEREFMLRMLRISGARVVEWKVNEPFVQTANYALSYAVLWQHRQAIYHA